MKTVMTSCFIDHDRFGLVYTTTASAHGVGCTDLLPTVKLSVRKRMSMNSDPEDWKTVRIFSGNLN